MKPLKSILSYHKYGKLFLTYIVFVLLISFSLIYNLSKMQFKSEIAKNISANYDTYKYPLYIVTRDASKLIPIPYTPEIILQNSEQYNNAPFNAKVIVNDSDNITVLLSEIEYSGEILIYDAIGNRLYNVPEFSKIIYSNNYRISFTPSYKSVVVTFALNYQ